MIAVFSGTGNSMWAAQRLADSLGDTVVALPAAPGSRLKADSGRVIWVFPVYSWGIPPVLDQIIRTIEIDGADTSAHFAVMTCGDDTGLTHRMWARAIGRRGWKGRGAWSVQMPNTYVLMKGFDVDPVELAQAKIDAAWPRLGHIAREIKDSAPSGRMTVDAVTGRFAWLKTKIVYPWFRRFAMSPRPFHATDDCIGCGICARSCPLGNIEMDGGRPRWHDRCALCLRCYHVCPRHCVAYGNSTRGKGQSRLLIKEVQK